MKVILKIIIRRANKLMNLMTFSLLCKNKVVEQTPGPLRFIEWSKYARSRPLTIGGGPEYV